VRSAWTRRRPPARIAPASTRIVARDVGARHARACNVNASLPFAREVTQQSQRLHIERVLSHVIRLDRQAGKETMGLYFVRHRLKGALIAGLVVLVGVWTVAAPHGEPDGRLSDFLRF